MVVIHEGHRVARLAFTLTVAIGLSLSACDSTPGADGGVDASPDKPTAPDVVVDAPDATLDATASMDALAPMDAADDLALPPDAATDARGDGGMRRDAADAPAATDASADATMVIDAFTDEAFTGPELLARPTDRSITVHVVPSRAVELYYEFGTAPGVYTGRTDMQSGTAATPVVTVLPALTANTRYYYRLRHRRPGETAFATRDEHTFFTQRPRGATFTFTVQADSHLDDRSDYAVYTSTQNNIARDRPDFHLDLGDTFMCDKHMGAFISTVAPAMDAATVDARYAFDRANFARIAHSVPLFLVNGNHEGESGWQLNGTPNNVAVWATLSRKRYFPNPEADSFYASTTDLEPFVGTRQAFYAFEWGDALFVTLDPFWYTRTRNGTDRWRWTLGEAQYRWLRRVLEGSTARYKFVFLHHLLGGINAEARGGVEAAPFFEWGGLNEDRTDGFATRRPGWGAPIHQVLRDTRVTAVFHGHDHVYVRQELDGIVYQEVPQPSASNFTNGATIATEGGYATGVVRSSSGHLRVVVSPANVTVDYVRATPPAGMRIPDGGLDGHSYTMLPR
jgi:hypothetical protein